MLDPRLLPVIAAPAIAVMLGCSGSNAGSTHDSTSGAGGTSGSGGGHVNATGGHSGGGTGGAQGTGGTNGSHAGSGGTGASGTGGRGNGPGATGSGGSGGTTDAGSRSDAGAADSGHSVSASQTCKNPAHVLPLNPDNPQDGITLDGFYVATDTWNAASYDVSQTLYVCDYDNWYVVANMNDDSRDGAVKTYPNVHKDYGDAPMISSFKSITSSFAHTAPQPHASIYEFAYDIWLNGVASDGSTEIMIWTDNYNQVPSGSSLDTVTYDGRSYDVYKSGSYIAFVDTSNTTSGTLNLLSFFQYVIDKGWIPASSTLGAIDYGVELVSTDGMDARFEVNAFSLATN